MEQLEHKEPLAQEEESPAESAASAAKSSAEEGRRLAKKPSGKGKRTAAIACGVAAAVLAGSYVGLCAYASGERVLPGVTVAGTDLSGMNASETRKTLEELAAQRFESLKIPLKIGGATVELDAEAAAVTLNVDATAHLAQDTGKESFFSGGARFLSGLVKKTELESVTTPADEAYVQAKIDEVAALVSQPMTETSWEIEETEGSAKLILTRGVTGQSVDEEALRQQVLSALRRGDGSEIVVEVTTAAPKEPDFALLAAEVARDAENATYDKETDEIIPHKLGLTLKAEDAEKVYAGLAEGESGEVELAAEMPEVTYEQLRVSLFRDVLGEAKSKVSGSANRVGNVRLASEACNGVILQPGERMSYNQTTGQRTREKGYREAGAYVGGKTVNEVGGGVCQPSSTLYLATLYADLKTVERKNHMYVVGYMPNGMDATVNWPNLDFVFENSTEYPIKVEMTMSGNILTARILGTKSDDTYIKMSSNVLEYYSYETEYKADESVPRGTTQVEQTPYTGLKSQCFKHRYDGEGNLLETELVSTDVYKKRNKIVLYNPADGVEGVIAPITSEQPAESTGNGNEALTENPGETQSGNTETPGETASGNTNAGETVTENTGNTENTGAAAGETTESQDPPATSGTVENQQTGENAGAESGAQNEELGIPTEQN